MSKMGFWLAVVAVSVIGIYLLKMAAAALPVPGFKTFMQAV